MASNRTKFNTVLSRLKALEDTPPGGGSGVTVRDGSGVPANGLGANGDYYLDTDTGDWYAKAAGVYTRRYENVGGGGPVSIVASTQVIGANPTGQQLSAGHDLSDGPIAVGGMSCPRTINVQITPFGAPLTGTLTINGISNKGEVIQDVLNLVDIFATADDGLETENAYCVITSAVLAGGTWENGGESDEIFLYEGAAFGLPVPLGATDLEVFYSNFDLVPGTVDADFGTIIPTTEFDGTVEPVFYFRYTAPAA